MIAYRVDTSVGTSGAGATEAKAEEVLVGGLIAKIGVTYAFRWKAGLALIKRIKNLVGKSIGAVKDIIASRKAARAESAAVKTTVV